MRSGRSGDVAMVLLADFDIAREMPFGCAHMCEQAAPATA